jgi:hypothetical protein
VYQVDGVCRQCVYVRYSWTAHLFTLLAAVGGGRYDIVSVGMAISADMGVEDIMARGHATYRSGVPMGGCTVRAPASLLAEARELGERAGLSRNAIMALALDEYMRRHGRSAPPDPYDGTVTTGSDLGRSGG